MNTFKNRHGLIYYGGIYHKYKAHPNESLRIRPMGDSGRTTFGYLRLIRYCRNKNSSTIELLTKNYDQFVKVMRQSFE